jgi:ORF6N domain
MPSISAKSAAPALQPHIARHILLLRSQRVMLDAELAPLYGVETKVLVQSIKRNLERFPVDFMFQLDTEEFANLRSQFVTSSSGYGGRRYAPYAFTEQGVAMSHETFSRNTKAQLREVFETLRALMTPPASPKRPIGFVHPQDAAKPNGTAVKVNATNKTTSAKAARKC